MGVKTITDLVELTVVADDDLFLVYDTSTSASKKILKSNLAGNSLGSSGSNLTIDGTSPLSLSGQAISLKNDDGNAITSVDTDTLANSDTLIPTSKAVKTYADTKIAQTTNITALNETGIADGEIAVFNLTNKDIRTSNVLISTDGTLAGNADTNVPTEKAVKTYVDKRAVYYSSDYASLAAFVTAISTTEAHLIINRDETVAASPATTIPATVAVTVIKGCVITVETGATLTINGSFQGGLYQMFNCAGTGVVVFGTGATDSVYPEWWGADGTGVTAASTIFAKMIASGCKQIRLVPGAIYRIKNVALPAQSYVHIDGQWGKIVADGTDGSPATAAFTVTFSGGLYYEFWEMENVLVDMATISGTGYGYFTDFLVITQAETGTVICDLHIKNIHAHGGRAGASTAANSVIKFINTGNMSPENLDFSNIYPQDNILVNSVIYLTNNGGSGGIGSMNVREIFHAVPDSNAKTIYDVDMVTVDRSSFNMIYNSGGIVISMVDCRHSQFSRIYQESIAKGVNKVISGSYADCTFDHIHQSQIGTLYTTDFDATTGWSEGPGSSIAVVSGGVGGGNCLKVSATGETYAGTAYYDITTVVGAKYALRCYFKKGTSDTGRIFIGTVANPTSIWSPAPYSDADWALKTKVFTATDTTTRISFQSDDADTGEYSLYDLLYVDYMDVLIAGAPLVGCFATNLFHYAPRGLLDHATVTLDADSHDNTIISLADATLDNYKAWENISDLGTNNTLPLDAVGTFVKGETRALDGASGDVSYTGYGFRPKSLTIYACVPGQVFASWGMVSNALTELCMLSYGAAALFSVSACIVDITETAGEVRQSAVVKSLDADGFTLTWTRTGSTSSGTIYMIVLASDR